MGLLDNIFNKNITLYGYLGLVIGTDPTELIAMVVFDSSIQNATEQLRKMFKRIYGHTNIDNSIVEKIDFDRRLYESLDITIEDNFLIARRN